MINKGKIKVIVRPMFAGKTEELIRRVKRAEIAEQNVLVFKHNIDNRYSDKGDIISHNGEKYECILIDNSEKVTDYIKNSDKIDIIAIDETQFFDKRLPTIVNKLADKGIKVICSGLDMDFKKEPFLNMAILLALADKVTKLKAVCFKCKEDANYTQRLVNGNPAKYFDPIIVVGGKESYEARCRNCHVVGR